VRSHPPTGPRRARRLLAVALAVGTTAAAGALATSTGAAAAAPTGVVTPNAQTLAVQTADALVAGKPSFLLASANDQFVRQQAISGAGAQYVPYTRTYAGLPVVGGDFVVVTNNAGQVVADSVAQDHAIGTVSTTPTLTSAQAASVASAQLKSTTQVEGTKLVVFALGAAPAALAWETTVDGIGTEGYSRLSVDVDARTGAVLHTQEHVERGTGTGIWNGPNPLTIDTTHSGSTYTMTTPNITNMPCQDAATNTTFSKSTDTWGNGVGTSRETGCVDALFGAQTEFKMLSQWLGRNGMDGNGGAWPIRIGDQEENAYYDGSQVQVGYNSAGQWIGSLDVIAHEMGHGIDDHTPGGISSNGTQEFVADTFGASTEWFANEPTGYDTPDFLVGDRINLVGSGPIRNMYNPSALGDANCYSSSIPGSEVHSAAGPGNHWFYLVAEGTNPTNGQPTSPTCNSSTVTGLGVQTAIKIMYNAMLMKTSSASYLKYRTWTLTAAKNLDATCADFNTVKAAWDAVSVPAQSGDPTCTGGGAETVTVNNPGSQSSTVGTAVSLTVTASDSQGKALTYSATGLPAGLSISSAGVVSGTPTTAATSSVTVTASSGTASGSATFSWVVNPVGTGCTAAQLIGNPGYETGAASPWTLSSGVLNSSTSEPAHGGTWDAWMDGYGTTHTDSASQSVTIPASCHSATLQFYLHIDTAETTTTTAYDKITVTAGSTTLGTFSNLNKATGYVVHSFSLNSFIGQTVTIKFNSVEDGSLQTSFVLDDSTLNVS